MAYFSAIGSEQRFTAPKAGRYYIEAAGAGGAVGNSYSGNYGSTPGKGARLRLNGGRGPRAAPRMEPPGGPGAAALFSSGSPP